MHADHAEFRDFLSLSSVVTGFTAFQLQGTGQAESYFSTLIDILGETTVAALLQTFRRVRQEAGQDRRRSTGCCGPKFSVMKNSAPSPAT
jgi:hypothetical protein